MSLVRRTSVAAVAVTGLVLALVMTLLASEASGAAAEPAAKQASSSGDQRSSQRRARPTSGRSRPAAKVRAGRSGGPAARLVTFNDRILGAQPVLSYRGFADPTVARYAGGWVGGLHRPGGAARGRPAARRTVAEHPLRADHAAELGDQRPDLGLGPGPGRRRLDPLLLRRGGRARPRRPLHRRRRPPPTPRRPSCPTSGRWSAPSRRVAPPAYDKIKRRGRDLPKAGVIDPELLPGPGREQYLLYRTQSTPSTIRIVQLPASGRAGRPSGPEHRAGPPRRRDREPHADPARAAVRADHLRGRVRRVQLQDDVPPLGAAHRLVEGPSARSSSTPRRAGCAGPAAPTWAAGASGEPLLFFHAWTCPELGGNCPGGHNYDREDLYDARRSLFAGVLRFTKRQSPRIAAYVAPIAPPPLRRHRRPRRRRP